MKNSAIIRIILFSLIAVLLIGTLIIGILFSRVPFMLFSEKTSSHVENIDGDIDTSYSPISDGNVSNSGAVPANTVSELEIQWIAGSITIEPGDTDEITFSESGNAKKPMVWKQTGNKLIIQFSEKNPKVFGGWWHENLSKDLTITVPKDWTARELDIDATSANVNISDLTITEVEVNSVSGALDLRNCVVEDFSAESVSGNVKFSGSLGSLDCNTVSADCIIVTDRVPREVELECVSGDMELTLPENAGFSAKMDSMKSDLTSDFPVTKNGSIYTSGDGACKIEFEGVSGDLTIRKTAQ